VVEEAVAALVFNFAEQHNFLDGLAEVDYELLRTIKAITSHLEVVRCAAGQWEDAILQAFSVWRLVNKAGGGKVLVDLNAAHISVIS